MVEPRPEINQKIDLIVNQGPYQGSYVCKVAGVKGDILQVTAPYEKGRVIPLRIDSPLEIKFAGKNSAYIIKATVIARQKEPIPMISLDISGDIKRIQRRQFFRLEAKIKVKYRIIDSVDEAENEEEENKLVETLTSDISAGGIKMVTDGRIPQGKLLELYLELPKIKDEKINGRVVNNYNLPNGDAVGVKFIEIATHIEDEIISYLLQYQRKLRQKGLL